MNKPPFILVVDDTRHIANFIVLVLRSAGFRAEACGSALECVGRIRVERPDFVIMDIMMPGMDGVTAASLLHDTPEFHGIPVVLLSALPEAEIRARAAEAGAAGILAKPFRKETILQAVRGVMTPAAV